MLMSGPDFSKNKPSCQYQTADTDSLCVLQLVWNRRLTMFRLQRRLRLQSAAPLRVAARHGVHKLASIKKVTSLPPKQMQSLLYPFSSVEAYLHRCCSFRLWRLVFQQEFLFKQSRVFRSVDRTPFQLFHPSVEDMVKAEKLFYSTPTHRIDYYISAERMDHAPDLKPPEVRTLLFHTHSVRFTNPVWRIQLFVSASQQSGFTW